MPKGAIMSRDPYSPTPNFPSDPFVERRSGCSGFFVGCGLFVVLIIFLIGSGLAWAWPSLIAHGVIQKDLSDYTFALEQSNLDPKIRDELIQDLDAVRLSIDEQNRFGFFQWISVQTEVEKILKDGRVDDKELPKLKTEIGRMKHVQGIQAK
jgi:hypothetical protein